jgi:hypothetical protein
MSGQGESRYPSRDRKQTEEGKISQKQENERRAKIEAASQKAQQTKELKKQVGNLSDIFSGLSMGSKGGRRKRTTRKTLRKRKTLRRK